MFKRLEFFDVTDMITVYNDQFGVIMAKTTAVSKKNPGMMFVMTFFIVGVINALIIYLANMFFPSQVVLGTYSLSFFWAILLPAFTLSLVTVLALPFITQIEMMREKEFSPIEYIVVYMGINFTTLWLLTRSSQVFGLGVSSWIVVLLLAAVLNFLQGGVMTFFQQKSK